MNSNIPASPATPPEPEHSRPTAPQRDDTRIDDHRREAPQSIHNRFSEPHHLSEQPAGDSTAPNAAETLTSSPNEPSRSDTTERDEPRPVASEHDVTRLDAIGRDEPSIDADDDLIVPDINWLDVEQAAELLKERGISRTIRTIQKMCKREDLVAKLVPTENGVRYIISDISIDEFVARHNQKLPSGGFASEPSGNEQSSVETNQGKATDQTSSVRLRDPIDVEAHFKEIVALKDQHIALVESQLAAANGQIAVKDEQIATMHERDHETNILIQNLQGLVALPERRSETPPQTNAGTGAITIDHRQDQASSQP